MPLLSKLSVSCSVGALTVLNGWAVLCSSAEAISAVQLSVSQLVNKGGPPISIDISENLLAQAADMPTNSPFDVLNGLPTNLPSDLPESLDETLPDRPSDPDEFAPEELPEDDLGPALDLGEDSGTSEPFDPNQVPEFSFFIETITINGNTVLSNEIAERVAAYEQREVTFEELLALRSELTQLYIDNGYVTSGVFLPSNQVLTDGSVTFQVVEGEVERIDVTGLRHLRPSYVRDRLALSIDAPLSRNDLEERLRLLQLDPFISQINAELTAGRTSGQNILLVDIDEPSPWVAGIEANNYRSPSIGSNELRVTAGRNNIVGVGDRLSTSYGFTEGLNIIDIDVSVPVNAHDGILSFGFNSSDSQIITDEFEDLDIESETRSYSFGFRQPVVRSPNTEVALGLGLDRRRRQTFILDDEPFSFSEGAEDGETNATILRFSQDWVRRSPRRVLAARSQFSLGLDAFDATLNDTGTDARFFSWIGQLQWVQQLSERNLIISRLSTQLTPDSLLSLEQFSIGGVDTVRGYTQNQRVADNGVLASVEARIPLTKNPQRLQFTPFLEAGTVWNNDNFDPENPTLVGIGLGLRWLIRSDLVAQIDYGIPLILVDDDSDSLQADGLYFSLRYQPF